MPSNDTPSNGTPSNGVVQHLQNNIWLGRGAGVPPLAGGEAPTPPLTNPVS